MRLEYRSRCAISEHCHRAKASPHEGVKSTRVESGALNRGKGVAGGGYKILESAFKERNLQHSENANRNGYSSVPIH